MHRDLLHEALRSRPFTSRQAAAAGLSRGKLKSLLAQRAVRRVLHGVYAYAEVPDTVLTRLAALRLVIGPHVVVCGRTAAWLYGVDTFRFAELDGLPPLETCVSADLNRLRRGSVQGRRRGLARCDMEDFAGLAATTALRTALDLGCGLPRRQALASLDQFLHLGLVTPTSLAGSLPRFTGYRGVIQLRELVALADGRAESTGESWTRLAIIDSGLPVPEPQFEVGWAGRRLFRLDLAYAKHRVCVEYDGAEFHDSAEDREHDEARRGWLRAHGWIVIVVRKEDFTTAAIERWTDQIRDALDSRVR